MITKCSCLFGKCHLHHSQWCHIHLMDCEPPLRIQILLRCWEKWACAEFEISSFCFKFCHLTTSAVQFWCIYQLMKKYAIYVKLEYSTLIDIFRSKRKFSKLWDGSQDCLEKKFQIALDIICSVRSQRQSEASSELELNVLMSCVALWVFTSHPTPSWGVQAVIIIKLQHLSDRE